jgi:hypothetical protein
MGMIGAAGTPVKLTGDEARNRFLAEHLKRFSWPGTPPAVRGQARQRINFRLDLQPGVSNDLVRKLFAATGTPYNLPSRTDSVPGPNAADGLLKVTNPDPKSSDSNFIGAATTARCAQISHSVKWTIRFSYAKPGYTDLVLVDGVYYSGVTCSQQCHDRPYILYTEPGATGQSLKAAHALNFYKKFYTEGGAVAPTSEIRTDLDILDHINNPPPGPVPAGGGAGDLS